MVARNLVGKIHEIALGFISLNALQAVWNIASFSRKLQIIRLFIKMNM